MELRRRLILFLLPLLSIVIVFSKGLRPVDTVSSEASFLSATSSDVAIRLAGAVPVPGVYYYPEGTSVSGVIKLTGQGEAVDSADVALPAGALTPGNVIEVTKDPHNNGRVTVKRMKAAEMMLLGIPLHPDQMDEDDWQSLPGIGPQLAYRIVGDRHKNGVFRNVQGVLRVSGLGERRLETIRKFFVPDNLQE